MTTSAQIDLASLMTYGAVWLADCNRERGETLTGVYCHYCPDWNYLPIDESCLEFVACRCFDTAPRAAQLAAG